MGRNVGSRDGGTECAGSKEGANVGSKEGLRLIEGFDVGSFTGAMEIEGELVGNIDGAAHFPTKDKCNGCWFSKQQGSTSTVFHQDNK